MKQNIKIPFSEKINYGLMLSLSFLFPLYLVWHFGFSKSYVAVIFLLALGCYSLYKIYENRKSEFIFSNLSLQQKKITVEKLTENKYFKILNSSNDSFVKLQYQKYALGLSYEIYFSLDGEAYEFNAFCNRFGIFDFGTRNRILNKIKLEINNCASL